MHDSLNKTNLLFPDPKINITNKINANINQSVPAQNRWFWLDENIGVETVYVLASESPRDNIKALLIEMEDADEPEKKIMEFAKDANSAFKTINFRHIDDKAFKEIIAIKHIDKKAENEEEQGSEILREMIIRGGEAVRNIPPSSILNTVNEERIESTLNNIKRNLVLEESRGVGGITVYKKASHAIVLVVTNEGEGSGSILDKEGHVLTNWHVIQGYDRVAIFFKPKKDVELKGEQPYFAKVIKVDQVTDLALLKIETHQSIFPLSNWAIWIM